MSRTADHDVTIRPARSVVVVCCVAVFLLVSPADASRDLPDSLAPTIAGPVAGPADLDRNPPVRPKLPLFSAADIVALSYGYDGPDQLLSLTSERDSVGHRLFQGLWTDPVTGIAYARNRWYDARTASWLSEDPKGAVDSPNLYAFVGWGPHVGRDPMGLYKIPDEEVEAWKAAHPGYHSSQLYAWIDAKYDAAKASEPKWYKRALSGAVSAWNWTGEQLDAGWQATGGKLFGAVHDATAGQMRSHKANEESFVDPQLEAEGIEDTRVRIAQGVNDVVELGAQGTDLALDAAEEGTKLYLEGKVLTGTLAGLSLAGKGLPAGIRYEGTIYRFLPKKHTGSAWDIHAGNITANGRYSAQGRGALYTGTSREASLGEMRRYGVDPSAISWVSKDIKLDNVLDLTNPRVRRQLGVSLEDLTGDDYTITQALGDLARGHYSGMLVPSARQAGTSNLVIFP